jgi:hypothetical protein
VDILAYQLKANHPYPLIQSQQLMEIKDPAAVALGRRGGKAKNAKLTKKQRAEMMAKVRAHRKHTGR